MKLNRKSQISNHNRNYMMLLGDISRVKLNLPKNEQDRNKAKLFLELTFFCLLLISLNMFSNKNFIYLSVISLIYTAIFSWPLASAMCSGKRDSFL